MASCEKRQRIDAPQEQDFSDYPKKLIKQLAEALQNVITLGQPHLVPLKIQNCNAADGRRGIPFSKAYCSTDESNDRFFFAEIFQRGLDILIDFVDQKELPANKQERYVLSKLLHYVEKDLQFPIRDITTVNETEITTLLANHLFGQLATSTHYLVDKNFCGKREKNQCVCEQRDCKLTGRFGDTSIGNGEVWHGKLNIILNSDLIIESVEEGKPDSPGGNSTAETKLKSTNLLRNPQIMAKTIVFSFLQKYRHPERDHFLFPCIGVGRSELVIMLYNSQNDVLLESRQIPLLDSSSGENDTQEVNLTAVLVSWLVVNHKYLCTGLTDDMKTYTADFLVHAKDKIEVYKENLDFGNVGASCISKKKVELKFRRGEFTRERSKRMSDILYSLYEHDDENPSTSTW